MSRVSKIQFTLISDGSSDEITYTFGIYKYILVATQAAFGPVSLSPAASCRYVDRSYYLLVQDRYSLSQMSLRCARLTVVMQTSCAAPYNPCSPALLYAKSPFIHSFLCVDWAFFRVVTPSVV